MVRFDDGDTAALSGDVRRELELRLELELRIEDRTPRRVIVPMGG